MNRNDKIEIAYQRLYPTGRAWAYVTRLTRGGKVPFVDGVSNPFVDGDASTFVSAGGSNDFNAKIARAKTTGMKRMYDVIYSILDQRFPDNDNFTEDDAENWERVFAIVPNQEATLEERNQRIISKYAYPNGVPERQYYKYIEEQLRAAGFDVYVHENRFQSSSIETQVGVGQVGVMNVGSYAPQSVNYEAREPDDSYTEICANFIDNETDNLTFQAPVGTSLGLVQVGSLSLRTDGEVDQDRIYRSSFFICGENYPDIADVPLSRKNEFRQLILSLKPTQTVSFNYINYTS